MENPRGWKCNLVHQRSNESLEGNEIVCEKQAGHCVRCGNALSQEFRSSTRQFCVNDADTHGGQAEPSGRLSVCLPANLTLTPTPAA